MGVVGAGKTTVGHVVAARLGVPFLDADDYHSPEAIALMRAGRPLDDAQRAPWLQRVVDAALSLPSHGFVLACSALKRSYRDVLRSGIPELVFVCLDVDQEVVAQRLGRRSGHFAGAQLAPTQFATLEPGDDIVSVSGVGTPDDVASRVLAVLGRAP